MKIGVDIDGVLTNYEQLLLEQGGLFFDKYGKKVECIDYDTDKMFDVSPDLRKKFFTEIMKAINNGEIYEQARFMASEVLNKLNEAGHEIVIITARGTSRSSPLKEVEKEIATTLKWLINEKIPFGRFFCERDKEPLCRQLNIDVMVEDSPENILDISKSGIPVICMMAKYNEHVQGDNIFKAFSWIDIERIIGNIEKGENINENRE